MESNKGSCQCIYLHLANNCCSSTKQAQFCCPELKWNLATRPPTLLCRLHNWAVGENKGRQNLFLHLQRSVNRSHTVKENMHYPHRHLSSAANLSVPQKVLFFIKDLTKNTLDHCFIFLEDIDLSLTTLVFITLLEYRPPPSLPWLMSMFCRSSVYPIHSAALSWPFEIYTLCQFAKAPFWVENAVVLRLSPVWKSVLMSWFPPLHNLLCLTEAESSLLTLQTFDSHPSPKNIRTCTKDLPPGHESFC